MSTQLLQKVTKPENTSGTFGTYTVKAKEGYIFTGLPSSLYINGDEWDLTGDNNPIVLTEGTDFREEDGDGNGFRGSQTVSINLQFDVPDLQPSDDATNDVLINMPVTKIPHKPAASISYLTFDSNGVPEFGTSGNSFSFQKFRPLTNTSSNTFYGTSAIHLGLGQNTYRIFVDNENDAFTVYSNNSGISITATNSKTVTVSNSVFTGSVTIYWGNVDITVSQDFGKASMIFSDGLRKTKNFIRYKPHIINTWDKRSIITGSSPNGIAKTDDCKFLAGNNFGGLPLESFTNGYSFSNHELQGNGEYRLTKENNVYMSLKFGTYNLPPLPGSNTVRTFGFQELYRSVDNITYTKSLLKNADGTDFTYQIQDDFFITDVKYAGHDTTNDQHVWYLSAVYEPGTQNRFGNPAQNQIWIFKSVDNGVTFRIIQLHTDHTDNDEWYDVRPIKSQWPNIAIWASIEYDYLVIYVNRHQHENFDGNSDPFYASLFRSFPSQHSFVYSNTNPQNIIRPIFSERHGQIPLGQTSTNPNFTSTHQKLLPRVIAGNYRHKVFHIYDNGIALYMGTDEYAVSTNYGLDWAKATLPTVTNTHSNGTTYNYPESDPTPFEYNGEIYVLTGTIEQYSTRNTLSNTDRLLTGLMKINLDDQSTLINSSTPHSFNDALSSSYQVSDIVDSWEVLDEYSAVTTASQNDNYYTAFVMVDEDQPDGVNRIFATTRNGLYMNPSPPASTLTNGASQATITTPTLPSGTTLETATGDPFLTEVYSDDPFSIVFTRGDGTQVQFDGVFDIIVASSTRPYIMDTVSGQTYTKYEGTFNQTTGATTISGGTFQNETLSFARPVNGVFYYAESDYNNLGFVFKNFVYFPNIQAAGTLRRITNRTDLEVNKNESGGGTLIKSELTATPPTITVPNGYSFSHKPINDAGGFVAHQHPLYLDAMFCFPKRTSSGYFNMSDIHQGMKIFADPQGIPFINGYYWRMNWNSYVYGNFYSLITPLSDGIPSLLSGKNDDDFFHIDANGYVNEIGDTRNLPDYNQCNY
jgi:hypothetical protein